MVRHSVGSRIFSAARNPFWDLGCESQFPYSLPPCLLLSQTALSNLKPYTVVTTVWRSEAIQ